MTARLDRLRAMRDYIDAEIASELKLLGAPLGADSLVKRAADLYGVAVSDILSGTREAQVTRARQAAAWLLRSQGMPPPDFGRVFGCHHTTVLHACRKIDGSPAIRSLLAGLEAVA